MAYNPAMRHPYYIKMVYGSSNPGGRPWREGEASYLHFAEDQRTLCNRFTEATGFLVYETGRNEGTKSILGRGTIFSLDCEDRTVDQIQDDTGKRYPLGVKVEFDKLVKPDKGVKLEEIYKLCPRLVNHFGPSMGGLIGITLEEFKTLSAALDKC